MKTDISQLFIDNKLRLTMPRIIIFTALQNATQPLSIIDIKNACPSINPTSIYRTIELFTNLAITTTVTHGWKQRFELADPYKTHHHHIRCSSCDTYVDIHSSALERQIAKIGDEHGFVITSHSFELFGTCQQCSTREVK